MSPKGALTLSRKSQDRTSRGRPVTDVHRVHHVHVGPRRGLEGFYESCCECDWRGPRVTVDLEEMERIYPTRVDVRR